MKDPYVLLATEVTQMILKDYFRANRQRRIQIKKQIIEVAALWAKMLDMTPQQFLDFLTIKMGLIDAGSTLDEVLFAPI